MLFQREALLEHIQDNLSILVTRVKFSNAMGRTDINSAAEDFYCGLLNILFGGYHLKNLNLLQMDFPAIDLGDEVHQLCVQVTSSEGRQKITSTLQQFFEKELHLQYNRLLVLIIGERPNYNKPFDIKYGFDFNTDRDIWDTARLILEINKLDEKYLNTLDNYLRTALNIQEYSEPLHLPLHTSLGVGGFVGRLDEIKMLKKAIADNTKPIIISGLGGMGKTELVMHFGRHYVDGHVYLASFQESFRKTITHSIAKGIPGLLEHILSEADVYNIVIRRLRQCGKNDILIIDNVDSDICSYADLLDDAYNILCGLDMVLIFTTRFDVPRAIEINQLHNSELYQIFQTHRITISIQEMDSLIHAVDGHTLTIDLMARTMRGSWRKVTADMLLNAIQERNLPAQNYRAVSTDYNRSTKHERIYNHLRTVFNVAGIPDIAKFILCCATLLPQNGLNAETFGTVLSADAQSALDDLIDHGWLTVKEDNIAIHPVVRLVCREELKPSDETCEVFLDSIWTNTNKISYHHAKFQQLADFYAIASEELPDKYGNSSIRSGWFYHEIGKYAEALKHELRAVAIRERNNSTKPEDLATAYGNLGNTYGQLGKLRESLKYQQKALAVLTDELPDNHPDVATIHNNIGLAYCDLGDREKALKHLLKSVNIRENNPSVHAINLAQSYGNIALCYSDQNEYDLAIHFLEKAMELLEKCEDSNSRFLCTLYNNLGGIHSLLNHWDDALYYQRKSLALQKRLYQDNHPESVALYHNIAMTYARKGDYVNALELERKSLKLAEVFYSDNHPYITIPKANISYIEQVLGSSFDH